MSAQAYSQAASVAGVGPPSAQAGEPAGTTGETIDDMIRRVTEEELLTAVEPGIVGDVDIANMIYTIPEGSETATPTMEEDEAMKSEGDSDVCIEGVSITSASAAPGGDVESSPAIHSESSSHGERGDPSRIWQGVRRCWRIVR